MENGDSNRLAIAAIASAGAAVLHAAAAGTNAELTSLSRLFIALAVAQAGVAVWGFVRPGRAATAALVGVNAGAFAGWLVTRLVGISSIPGLETAERPQLANSVAAILAVITVFAALASRSERTQSLSGRAVVGAAILTGLLVVPGLAAATSDDDRDDDRDDATSDVDGRVESVAAVDEHDHDEAPTTDAGTGSVTDDHADHAGDNEADEAEEADDTDHADHDQNSATETASAWPRPWDPAGEIDFSGVPGVTAEQQERAEQLVVDTLRDLPAFADVSAIGALGYHSIGDSSTGFEHYINSEMFDDGRFLDPTAPESLVYEVDGDERTLVSAMFIAGETPIDDPALLDFAGPLMQWHVHDNLCWALDADGQPVVRAALENPGDTCPTGTVLAGGNNPMVHVWVAPHECGPFAALEGQGAGQTTAVEGERADQCGNAHAGHDTGDADGSAETATKPYDPDLPIDLGGVEGVTLQQQAFAENLVAATIRDLPQWADLDVVEAAGFHSIGDAATGHEHYIQWDWIDDDVWLDPDYPESLVFEPQPDGTKKLVSVMYMLPSGYPLEDVPDYGGRLMQWHVHRDLCFTDDPVAPKVAGLKQIGTTCTPPLVDGTEAPMIHVWIRPHQCGPFAALDGIGGGQVPDGEEVWCDQAHGDH